MAHKCPHCGAPLPAESSFCPHCATDIHPRKQAKTATPLLKKLLLGLLALAVLAAVGFGLWLAFAPKTYDGYGEVHYGDWQLLLTQHTDRYTPVPEMTIPGEPEGQYRVPSRLFINDSTGNDVSDAFLAEVEEVSAAFIGQEDSSSPYLCSQPAYNEGAPECPLISLIDFTGESGAAELVWTFQMKNGDTIHLRQTYEVVPIPVYDYYPEDYPMDTAEELQALIDTIGGQANDPVAVINLHLPPVTYEGGITIRDRSPTLWGGAAAPVSPAPLPSGPPTAPSPAGTPGFMPTAPAGSTSSAAPSKATASASTSTARETTPTTPCTTTTAFLATMWRCGWTTYPPT